TGTRSGRPVRLSAVLTRSLGFMCPSPSAVLRTQNGYCVSRQVSSEVYVILGKPKVPLIQGRVVGLPIDDGSLYSCGGAPHPGPKAASKGGYDGFTKAPFSAQNQPGDGYSVSTRPRGAGEPG